MSARLRLLSIFAVSCFPLALPTSARAQGQGGSSNWAVTVGTSVPVLTHDTASGPHTIGFVVTNTGTKSNAVSLACGATGEVTCDGLSLSSVTLAPDEDVTVEVTYSVGYTNGTVELTATGEHKSGGVAQYIVKVPPSAVSRAKAGGGGGGSYSVAVAPDYAPVTKPSNTTQNASFTIYNSGQYADTYTLTCIGIGVGCVSVNPTSLSLDPLDDGAATVTYTVGTSSGTLKLRAAGIASDYGSYLVTPSNVPPTVSLAPHNAGYRDVAKCVAGCFDGTWAHSTPAYVSLGTPRSVTLQYSSANAKPLSVIFLDVSMPSGWAPTTYSFQVRTTATGALLTLGNGTQTVFYTASGTQLNRVALAVSPLTNGLTTGWYDVEVLATANYASGGPATTTVTTRLLVVDENGSIFGRGVTMPGLQQLHFKTGSYSVAVTEGDGSIAYYHRPNGTAPFETPGGTSLSLIDDGNGFYRRVALDGSYVTFNASGRMINAVDRFGNTTSYTQVSEYLYYITDPMGKKFTFTYQNGKLYQVKGPGLLRTTTYTYDGSNRLTKITDPDGLFTQFGYDGSNRLTTITNRAGKVTTLTYDGVHRVSTVTAPSISLYTGGNAQPVVTLTAAERVVWQPSIPGTSASSPKGAIAASTVQATVKDPLNYTTKYKLDKHGAPTAITDALSQTTTITRDSMARPTVVLSPSGFRMQYYYGSGTQAYLLTAMSNITTGRTINYAYNSNHDATTITGDVERRDFHYHDGTQGPAGAVRQVWAKVTGTYPSTQGGRLIATHYPDGKGRDTLVTDGAGHSRRYTYSTTWGSLLKTKNAVNDSVYVHHDAYGRVDTTYAPSVGSSSVTYGLLNQVLSAKDPAGFVTTTDYNGNLTVKRLVDPKGQVYKYSYNALGWLVAEHDLGDTTKADTLKYDAGGNLRSVKTRRGDVISMTYDALGRPLTHSGPDFPTNTYRYDAAGRWMVATNTNGYDSLAYDVAGRLEKSFQKLNGVTWQWNYTNDIRDRVTNRSAPGGLYPRTLEYDVVTPEYCAAGACVLVTPNSEDLGEIFYYKGTTPGWYKILGRSSTHSVDTVRYSETQLSNVFYTASKRDPLHQITSQRITPSGSHRVFTYDNNGQLLNACDSVGGQCVNEWGGQGNAYQYDAAGNRLRGGESLSQIGPGNRVDNSGGWFFRYDANGNVTSKCTAAGYPCAQGTYYTWDALNRLIAVKTQSGALIASFAYDAMGRRVAKTTPSGTERYVYDGDHVVLDLNGSNQVTTEYGFLPGTDQVLSIKKAAWTGIPIVDPEVGTIRGLVNYTAPAQILKDYRALRPWGVTNADTGQVVRLRLAGREFDQETGLYYMRARFYDPSVGRFLSEDPIGIAGGLNLYAYGLNNAVSVRDPSGTCPAGGTHIYGMWRVSDYGQVDWPCIRNPSYQPEPEPEPEWPVWQDSSNDEVWEECADGGWSVKCSGSAMRYGVTDPRDCFGMTASSATCDLTIGIVPGWIGGLGSRLGRAIGPGSRVGRALGRGFPTKLNRWGRQQPYDPRGRWMDPNYNPGVIHSPAVHFLSGIAQGLGAGLSGGDLQPPSGKLNSTGQVIGKIAGTIWARFH